MHGSSYLCYDGNEGVNIPSRTFNVWMKIFISSLSLTAIFWSLSWQNVKCMVFAGMSVWVYGYLWGPLETIICWVLAGPWMCMCWEARALTIPGLWCLRPVVLVHGNYRGIAQCVCWIGVCGLFGVLLCCVRLCEDLLCVGGCRWRVGVRSHVSILWFGQLRLEYISSRKMLF